MQITDSNKVFSLIYLFLIRFHSILHRIRIKFFIPCRPRRTSEIDIRQNLQIKVYRCQQETHIGSPFKHRQAQNGRVTGESKAESSTEASDSDGLRNPPAIKGDPSPINNCLLPPKQQRHNGGRTVSETCSLRSPRWLSALKITWFGGRRNGEEWRCDVLGGEGEVVEIIVTNIGVCWSTFVNSIKF